MKTNDSYDVILVGGGPASRILNKYLHKLRTGIRTVVIRDEDRIINHCGTPYIVEGEIPWEKGLIPEKLVTGFDTEILVDPLVGGDPANKEIELKSGRRLRYGTLVCATGTDQVVPPVPGADLAGVLKVRRTEDVQAAMEMLGDVKRAVVVG
ncbi:MAG: FAD-dependent oxidoreductase, partial [Candidatus Krumholzibacteriota bacterium]